MPDIWIEQSEANALAVEACERFFAVAIPQMNVRDSALDADAIEAWNKAELAVAAARRLAEESA